MSKLPQGVSEYQVNGWQANRLLDRADWLAEEVPVALVFNGISHAVMMASPADLEDFALGFGLSEGLLERASELYAVDVRAVAEGIEVHLEVSSACEWRLKARSRSLAGRTGCGLCGVDSLAQVHRKLIPVPAVQITTQAISRAQQALQGWQVMQQLTGATHAAAWCALSGEILRVREDVGRHNALDKLIGDMVRATVNVSSGFICITSRASFEMVQKTVMAGVSVLAAVSAPTALAVDIAKTNNLALAGFVRGNDLVAYSFPERFGLAH